MCVEGFTTKTWLRWFWGWQVRSVALRIGIRRGRVHFQGGISSFSGKLYALWLRPFNWLDQAHPGNWESSPLFKINWLHTLTTSTKHLQSSILVSVWVFEDCSLTKTAHQTDHHSWWYHPFLWLLTVREILNSPKPVYLSFNLFVPTSDSFVLLPSGWFYGIVLWVSQISSESALLRLP